MGIVPHKDVARAMELSFGLDIPFWPQLPNMSFYEDMYAQASENFPGMTVDPQQQAVLFDSSRFEQEVVNYSERMNDPDYFLPSEVYSRSYRKFVSSDLHDYIAVRGQVTGPVSFGFRVLDETQRPIIYNDSVRGFLFDFMQRKINAQYRQLREKNTRAFVWVDEPSLGFVFAGTSGYCDAQTTSDYVSFFEGVEGVKALHLCANVNLPYILNLGAELVSFDAYQIEAMPKAYSPAVADFLGRGGVIAWGTVPIDTVGLGKESAESLAKLLVGYWDVLSRESGIATEQIASRALLAPARCCQNIDLLKDLASRETDMAANVEQAFGVLAEVSHILKDKFGF